jgi:hypothetical protein
LDWFSSIQPFEREGFYLIFRLLVGFDNALKVSFDGDPFGLCTGAKSRFEFRVNGDA